MYSIKRGVLMKKIVKKPKTKIVKPARKIVSKIKQKKPAISKPVQAVPKIQPKPASVAPATEIDQKFNEVKSMLSSNDGAPVEKQITAEEHPLITQEKKHQGYSVFGVVFSILGFVIPLVAILGIIFGFLAEKNGSRFGKAICLLGFIAFIVNLYIIFGTSFYDIIS
jgi:hypothetical protein